MDKGTHTSTDKRHPLEFIKNAASQAPLPELLSVWGGMQNFKTLLVNSAAGGL